MVGRAGLYFICFCIFISTSSGQKGGQGEGKHLEYTFQMA